MTRITIYDTTLRDGAQGEGISLSVADKLKIATKLDWLGVDYVEGGWPGSNPKDAEFFRQARTRTWDHAKITAFSSTRRPGIAVERDPTMVALLEAGTEWVTLFGKSWTLHVEEVLETTRGERLGALTEVAHTVAETANMTLHNAAPYVGHSAFAHKGGVHVSAMRKVATSYQHIDPALVGNHQRVLVSELSGRGNVLAKAAEARAARSAVSESQARTLVQRIKVLESDGYQFEGADGSFQLLIRRMDPDYRPPFELIDFLSLVERRAGSGLISEATVKIRVGEEVIHTAGSGNGPVNALDAAVRKVLLDFYPALRDVHLLDYKVRVVDGASGTAAITRVLIETGDGRDSWTTVGSSTNIIEASWLALADSLEYAIIRGEA